MTLKRRDLLKTLGAGAAGLTLGAAACRSRIDRPNVVLIVADDMGYECVRANGGAYDTPRLDSLAAEGMRFTRAFCMPVCTPSRVQLMSGEYPHRNGWNYGIWHRPRRWQVVDPQLFVLPRTLRALGYATLAAGKWQLARLDDRPDHPERAGFDEHCLWTWRYGERHPSRYWSPLYWQNGELRRDLERPDVFGPDLDGDYVRDFLRRRREGPFFVYYASTLPHEPFVTTPANRESREKGVGRFPGMVSYFDDIVGRIVDAIDGLGLRERTLVLVTADNGTVNKVTSKFGGASMQGGKHGLTDAGTRVPLIARWPGTIPSGRVCDDLVDLSDFPATIAEAVGESLPRGKARDGRSFWSSLLERPGERRRWVLLQKGRHYAARGTRWKLYDDGWFFDLEKDALEFAPIHPSGLTTEAAIARMELARVLAETPRIS